jgi:hypothetical protein
MPTAYLLRAVDWVQHIPISRFLQGTTARNIWDLGAADEPPSSECGRINDLLVQRINKYKGM